MAGKNLPTGCVITVEGVPTGHQIGVAWVKAHDPKIAWRVVGFAYDEDETPQDTILDKIAAFCVEHELTPNGDSLFAQRLSSPDCYYLDIEEINDDEFFERFGGMPRLDFVIFDEGASIDDNRGLFGVPAGAEMKNNDRLASEMHSAAIKSGAYTAVLICGIIAAFFICGFLIGMGTAVHPAQAVAMLLVIVLAALGVITLISNIKKLSSWVYKKIYR